MIFQKFNCLSTSLDLTFINNNHRRAKIMKGDKQYKRQRFFRKKISEIFGTIKDRKFITSRNDERRHRFRLLPLSNDKLIGKEACFLQVEHMEVSKNWEDLNSVFFYLLRSSQCLLKKSFSRNIKRCTPINLTFDNGFAHMCFCVLVSLYNFPVRAIVLVLKRDKL